MASLVIKDMGGMIPRRDSMLLPDNMAEQAVNCDVTSGPLDGLAQPKFVIDLALAADFPVRKAYRFPSPTPGGPDAWLPLPSEWSSVCRSPLANDTLHRIYWTNPPGQPNAGAFWNTYERILAGGASNFPYNMGFIAPDIGITLAVSVTGGTTTVPAIARSYCFTYVDQYGQESSPSTPSAVVEGPPDGTWTISGFPATPPLSPSGKVYPQPVKMRLYRTITGATTGAQFYQVSDIAFGTTTFTDILLDERAVNNPILETASWAPPPDGLDGLIAMPGGMLVGFTGNTVHFCEPDRPNAWPAGYDQSLLYPIVAFAVWQQSLVALTQGYPSTGTGNSPSQFTFAQVQAPEPCIARGSVITDLAGVYYASENGLIMLNYFGMQNQTLSNFNRPIWLRDYKAADIVACRHRVQYLAINGTGTGFLIDYSEQRMGVMHIEPMLGIVSVWNDAYTGDAYMCGDEKVYLWDAIDTPALNYRWRSKQFFLPAPTSFGACQINAEPEIAEPVVTGPPPMFDTFDSDLDLPDGVNALIRFFVGPNAALLLHEENLVQPQQIFRIPGGIKAFEWQVEIVSRVPINSVELASTMKELRTV